MWVLNGPSQGKVVITCPSAWGSPWQNLACEVDHPKSWKTSLIVPERTQCPYQSGQGDVQCQVQKMTNLAGIPHKKMTPLVLITCIIPVSYILKQEFTSHQPYVITLQKWGGLRTSVFYMSVLHGICSNTKTKYMFPNFYYTRTLKR